MRETRKARRVDEHTVRVHLYVGIHGGIELSAPILPTLLRDTRLTASPPYWTRGMAWGTGRSSVVLEQTARLPWRGRIVTYLRQAEVGLQSKQRCSVCTPGYVSRPMSIRQPHTQAPLPNRSTTPTTMPSAIVCTVSANPPRFGYRPFIYPHHPPLPRTLLSTRQTILGSNRAHIPGFSPRRPR